ncbi:MAG TPA: Ig-like domain-containing protein, partial [bacterium]|nr:Ig-like domain-containing protein [bacterium]
NVLAVKYNSSGVAQWARSTEVAPDSSGFSNIAIDAAGNFYATGYIINNNLFDFGNNTTVSGAASLSLNALLVKYNAEGKAQWARSTETAGDVSEFGGVATDAAGNVYVSGNMSGTGTYGFGNGVTVAGKYEYDNNVLVKYNPSGTALWARSATKAPDSSCFFGVTTDAADNVYVAGYITGNSQFDFGNGVTTTGAYSGGDNALLVKYAGLSTDIVYQNLPGLDKPINIEDGDVITVPLFTIKVKPYSEVGISKVEFYVDDNLLCTSHTSDKDGVYSCKWDTTKYHSTVKVITYNAHGGTATLTRTASVSLTVLPKTGR